MKTFINLSNHSSLYWDKMQLEAASSIGKVVDIPFPAIDPHYSSIEIDELVNLYYNKVIKYDNPTVMLQGEFIFTYRLVNKLKEANITVVAACSERKTIEQHNEDGTSTKTSIFSFVGFKEY